MNLSEVFKKMELNSPPGLRDKTMPLDDFIEDELNESEEAEAFIRDRQSGKIDSYGNPSDMKSAHKIKKDVPLIHKSIIIDKNGNPLSMKEIGEVLSIRPNDIIGKNSKMEHSADGKTIFYKISIPPLIGLYHDEKTDELKMVRTCPGAGTCKQDCFARKGNAVQYKQASQFQSRVLTFLMNDFEGFKKQLLDEITSAATDNNKKGINTIIRWHDTGDFFRKDYLDMAMDIARQTKDLGVKHYAYTKSIRMVKSEEKPSNFIFNYSQGGLSDKDIEPSDKGAIIVPADVFSDLMDKKKEGWVFKSDETREELKRRISDKYDLKNVIVYDEMMEKPEGDGPKWNVIVYPGNGDNAATRGDVIKSLLLIH